MEKKDILILGGGISGCTVAYLLKKRGYCVRIIEKESVGGLCRTQTMGDIFYEFGPHICYANENTTAYELFHKLLPEFQYIKYFPKQSMDGEVSNLATFPITVANVLKLPEEDKVKAIEELYHINLDAPNYDNFEKYIISRVGKTMYEYCYKNYNKKQWGLEPKNMDSEWAKFRNFYLRSGDYGMFGDLWQGHPGDYNPFFNRLTENIEIIYDTVEKIIYEGQHISEIMTKNGKYMADIIISTLPIDFVLNRNDELDYRGITKLFYLLKGESGLPTYLCTFPNHYSWTRITDYGLQAKQKNENSLISFAVPHSSKEKEPDFSGWIREADCFVKEKLCKEILERRVSNFDYVYPVSSGEMLRKYDDLIKNVSEIDNLVTFGRLGLYSYISMCTAINQANDVAENIHSILKMECNEKYQYYRKLRERLS
ncbi:MAG: FAD-dependent oxidoreductase [Lachnospiraceae bacterium]|nr:FAD-dependent oxidoreductase [Lachnospiraceae bacterium]